MRYVMTSSIRISQSPLMAGCRRLDGSTYRLLWGFSFLGASFTFSLRTSMYLFQKLLISLVH